MAAAKGNLTSELQAWNQLTAAAPDSVKSDMQVVGTFLQATVSHDYTALGGLVGKLPTALTHVETYFAANCHG